MEPFALGVILAQGLANIIVPEVVGGRADAAVCAGFKAFINYIKQEEGKLANHDLQKAPRRSFLSALQNIAL